MKKILKSILTVMMTSIIIVSCEDDTISPLFPEKTEVSSVLKEAETITFEANMDWEISLPVETISYFWIDDPEKGRVQKVSGKAGKHTVTIGVTDEPDFENDIYCPVTMTMGGEKRLVAEYTLLKSVKSMEVYPCKVDALGYYRFLDAGGADYEESSSDVVRIAYHNTTGFSIPVRFDAGVNYEIKSQPEWLEVTLNTNSDVAVGRRGNCQALLKVKEGYELPENQPLEGQMCFNIRRSEEVLKNITVRFEPVTDFLSWEGASEIMFGGDGTYAGIDETQTSYKGIMYSSKDVVLFAAAQFRKPQVGGTFWTGSDVDWVKITDSPWDSAGDVLQRHEVTIEMEMNAGEERTADIYALPANVAKSLAGGFTFDPAYHPLNDTWDDVKDEVKPYKIATLIQEFGGDKIVLLSPQAGATLHEVDKAKYTADSGEMEMRYAALTNWSISELNKGLYHLVTSSNEFSINVAGSVDIIDAIRYIPGDTPDEEGSFEVDDKIYTVSKEEGRINVTINSDKAVEGALIFKDEQIIPIVALWIEYTPSEQ